jgi:hypothetical protein
MLGMYRPLAKRPGKTRGVRSGTPAWSPAGTCLREMKARSTAHAAADRAFLFTTEHQRVFPGPDIGRCSNKSHNRRRVRPPNGRRARPPDANQSIGGIHHELGSDGRPLEADQG